MRPIDIKLGQEIEEKLCLFEQVHSMPGIGSKENRVCFIEQIIDSIRRIKYISFIRDKHIDRCYADPENNFFDPLKAASWHKRQGNTDEAFWLVFLAIHFGKNKTTGWRLLCNIYRGEGANLNWTWERTSNNINAFRSWLHSNNEHLKQTGNFGNHRKYESLNALGNNGTGEAIETYINWVGPEHSHTTLLNSLQQNQNIGPRLFFNLLYNSMNSVTRFGRTARFDYATMIGKLGLCKIEPASTYMSGSTGPYTGANLLFANNANAGMNKRDLDQLLIEMEKYLGLYFGMQVLEDALCNWQKSPSQYVHFIG